MDEDEPRTETRTALEPAAMASQQRLEEWREWRARMQREQIAVMWADAVVEATGWAEE